MRIEEMQLRQTTENQIKINFTNNKTSTKCTKMTEESDIIRNGMSVSVNGGGATQNGASGCNSKTSTGGRLQFFKDGKFILELASARENENGRTAWVAVPRKTFWPPTAPPFTNNYSNCNKNESSTSLSFSDDNSSIQSSPWQRDHCWKQLTPRRNISQEMSMLYIRPAILHLSKEGRRLAKVKKRRPYDIATALHKIIFSRCHNGVSSLSPPQKSDETTKDCTDAAAAPSAADDTMMVVPPEEVEGGDNKKDIVVKMEVVHTVKTLKTVKILKNRIPLSTIVQKLMDRLPTGLILLTKTPALVANHHFSACASPKVDATHQQHVSPRKRILRELERVSLDDNVATMKRHRAKNTTNTVVVSSTRSVAAPSATVISKTVMPNGSSGHEAAPPATTTEPVVTKPISSYSIISLLGHTNSSKATDNKNPSTSHAKENDVSPGSPASDTRMPPKKKQSPPYGNWSPKATPTPQNSSPSPNVGSPQHSYNLMRSPDLSPSPEQQLSRYKSHYTGLHYGGSGATTSSSGGASYHPYLGARASPSGTSSPSSDTYSSRYRTSSSTYMSGSPQHNRANNNSPSSSSPFSRYSPIPNVTYPPVSPQHFGPKVPYTTNPYGAPPYGSTNRMRSPSHSPATADVQVTKKTAHKAQRSPVASPHDPCYGSSSSSSNKRKPDGRKYNDDDDDTRVPPPQIKDENHIKRDATPPDSGGKTSFSNHELEYLAAFSKANSHHLLSGIDMAFAAMIRPPSYLMYPPSGAPLQPPPGLAAFLPTPPFFSPMYPSAMYRQQSWLHFPPLPPSAQRLPTASLLPYDGLGPPVPSSTTSPSSTTPWGPVPHGLGASDNSTVLDRIKDDPSSDVPLNLSKH